MSAAKELDALIEELDAVATQASESSTGDVALAPLASGDALDLIVAGRPRETKVVRLRDSEVVRQFREDLVAGLVGMERLEQVLKLIASAVVMVKGLKEL